MEENKEKLKPQLVLIGGSAGSLTVLLMLLPDIRRDFVAPIVIVTHRKSYPEEHTLEMLLKSKTSLTVKEAEEKEILKAGAIYIAPADYHLLFESDGTVSLDHSEKVNHSRPSIDVSFESAAKVYGKGLTAVLLSGSNADGMLGLEAVAAHDGVVMVQDPDNADMSYMPMQAIQHLTPTYIFKDSDLSSLLNNIIGLPDTSL